MSTWEKLKCLLAFVIGGLLAIFGFSFLITTSHFDVGTAIFGGLLFAFLGYVLLAYIPASIAFYKGRSYNKWFIYGFFIWPIAVVHSLLATNYEKEYKECPYCAERIKKAAKVCKYCGRDLTENSLAIR